MKEFEVEDLPEFDGKEERPAYILYRGKVFDVSESKLWKGGLHMRRHHAGKDLTTDLGAAPHGEEVFQRYPQVGVIKRKELPEIEEPRLLLNLFKKYPMLRRHPHPMTVHFPIVFMFSTTAFTVLYLLTSISTFETTAIHCLAAGILFTPLVILTGIISWWVNYLARPLKPVKIKITTSLALFVVSIIVLTWRISNPDILNPFRAASFFYFLLVLSLSVLVTIVGWFGAKMTFPIERE